MAAIATLESPVTTHVEVTDVNVELADQIDEIVEIAFGASPKVADMPEPANEIE